MYTHSAAQIVSSSSASTPRYYLEYGKALGLPLRYEPSFALSSEQGKLLPLNDISPHLWKHKCHRSHRRRNLNRTIVCPTVSSDKLEPTCSLLSTSPSMSEDNSWAQSRRIPSKVLRPTGKPVHNQESFNTCPTSY